MWARMSARYTDLGKCIASMEDYQRHGQNQVHSSKIRTNAVGMAQPPACEYEHTRHSEFSMEHEECNEVDNVARDSQHDAQ